MEDLMADANLIKKSKFSYSIRTYSNIASSTHARLTNGATGQIAIFLLKVAALEIVRRISASKCPIVWPGLQALQVLCYPPFNWIKKWAPFKGLIKGIQALSRPLLVLSIATTLYEQLDCSNETKDDNTDDHSEQNIEEPSSTSVESTINTRSCDESSQSFASAKWKLQLYKELDNQGISLPERINEDELNQFYTAANGDFSCMLSSVTKTISWREKYGFLEPQELEIWSNLIFWHGLDVKNRQCLFVRLGLACFSLPPHERPRFAQALVSQIEHGILHLVDAKNPQITVLVDCEGLPPARFPMQKLKSCSALLQDHFPNRLGRLFVLRLPPSAGAIAQTFIQVLKPVTQEKIKIANVENEKDLFEYLQTLPSYFGGKCRCKICARISNDNMLQQWDFNDDDDSLQSSQPSDQTNGDINVNCDQILRTSIISIIMFWVLVAVIAGLYDPVDRLFLHP